MIKHAEQHRLNTVYGKPDFYKEAELPSDEELGSLPNSVFADPVNRRYPCHTKTACYVSNAQFWENAIFDDKSNTETGRRLLKLAEFWEISDSITQNILQKVAAMPVVQAFEEFDDEDFALAAEHPTTGEKIRLYPATNADTVKLAAAQLYNDRFKLPFEWRRKAAQNLMKKADQFGVSFDGDDEIEAGDYLEKAAEKGISSIKTIATELLKRAAWLKQNRQSEKGVQLEKAAEQVSALETNQSNISKLAEFIAQIDEFTGIHRAYGEAFMLPEEACRSVLYKDAEAEVNKYIKTKTGNTYSKSELEKAAEACQVVGLSHVVDGDKVDVDKLEAALEKLSQAQVSNLELALHSQGISSTVLPIDLDMFK